MAAVHTVFNSGFVFCGRLKCRNLRCSIPKNFRSFVSSPGNLSRTSSKYSASNAKPFPVTETKDENHNANVSNDSSSSKYFVLRRYIPMTRKALVKRILDQENIIKQGDREHFQEFAGVLDRAISGTFLGVLGELKVIITPHCLIIIIIIII